MAAEVNNTILIRNLQDRIDEIERSKHGGGSGGGGGNVDADRLTKLETKIETILPTLATKGDVSEAKASIVIWASAFIAASTVIVITVVLNAINNKPPQAATQQQTPVYVYPQPQANPTAPQSPPATKPGR